MAWCTEGTENKKTGSALPPVEGDPCSPLKRCGTEVARYTDIERKEQRGQTVMPAIQLAVGILRKAYSHRVVCMTAAKAALRLKALHP